MNKLNKLQDLKTTLTQKQRIILLVVAVVVVLGALTATVFRDNAASFLRWMTYSQKDDDFPHNAQSNSLFLGMGDDLADLHPDPNSVGLPHGNRSSEGDGQHGVPPPSTPRETTLWCMMWGGRN